MTATQTSIVQVAVTINAEPETVWRFLSEPDKFLSWMTYLPGSPTPPGSTFEPRPGGSLRIIFPNGGEAKGAIVELEPRKRLVFTWGYDPDVAKTGLGPGACRVEVALTTAPKGTRVTLTHTGPMSEELARGHEAGWRHYLSQLAVNSTRHATDAHSSTTLGAYFAAWNERHDAKRLALLQSCCDQAVEVRTPFACSDTIDELTAHIANGLRHMPGCATALNGAVKHIHGFARAPWVVTGADGKTIFAGENLLRFSPAGKIGWVVSFHS